MNVLLAEDERISRITLTDLLAKEGYAVVACASGDEALGHIRAQGFDVVLTDLRLPGAGGLDVLREAKARSPHTIVIVMTAYATVDTAVEALRLGAYDYLTKPFPPDRLLRVLQNVNQFRRVLDENEQLRQRISRIETKTIVGDSAPMRKLQETIRLVAAREYTVLIRGESGTGKELVARALHEYSPRKERPFVTLNCAALPASLLESELFGHERGAFTGAVRRHDGYFERAAGHERGAFTGAVRRHDGYFERAAGGTVFIDEIDDFPLDLQPRLLRVLQEKEIVRVGGSASLEVDVRIIGATKADLQEEVKAGRFRADLFYRLNIIPIMIPPLRDRKDDLVPLAAHFFEKHGAREVFRTLSPPILEQLRDYDWPGNVRELENLVERVIALSDTLSIEEIIRETLPVDPARGLAGAGGDPSGTSYSSLMEEKEREIISAAMEQAKGNVTAAARLLDLPRSTLRSKLEKWSA